MAKVGRACQNVFANLDLHNIKTELLLRISCVGIKLFCLHIEKISQKVRVAFQN